MFWRMVSVVANDEVSPGKGDRGSIERSSLVKLCFEGKSATINIWLHLKIGSIKNLQSGSGRRDAASRITLLPAIWKSVNLGWGSG